MQIINDKEFKIIAASVDTKLETVEDAVKWAGRVAALSVEYQLEACEKEHKAVIREIRGEILNRSYPEEEGLEFWFGDADWQEFWRKYGGE